MRLLKRMLFGKHSKICYSQSGEDLIIEDILTGLGILEPSYIDIGAHSPEYISNTYLLYRKGNQGICIEPNPELYKIFKKKRPRDICLNIGIGVSSDKEAPFYCMTNSTLSTFSKKEAERMASCYNEKIEQIIAVPLMTFAEVVHAYLPTGPNFVSLDVEGFDLAILQSIDFSKFRPQILCVETLTYTADRTGEKITPTIQFMQDKGYFVYADTYVNTIFVDKAVWASKR